MSSGSGGYAIGPPPLAAAARAPRVSAHVMHNKAVRRAIHTVNKDAVAAMVECPPDRVLQPVAWDRGSV